MTYHCPNCNKERVVKIFEERLTCCFCGHVFQKVPCPICNSNGYYTTGETDKPVQVQCNCIDVSESIKE